MSILIRGGMVVTAEQSFRADVYCENGIIAAAIFGLRSISPTAANLVSGTLASSQLTGLASERGY
mgnify:CR=1 FL=1